MRNVGRRLAFVLASTNHGSMIVNRFDRQMIDSERGYGVGYQLLEGGAFDPVEVEMAVQLLELRRKHHGDGVVGIDCGANIGVHTIEWATAMTGWGSVVAIEAQERVYYALAGNVAINNCFNAIAMHAAVSSTNGTLQMPAPDYFTESSFGSLELRQREGNEFIGQRIDYAAEKLVTVQQIAIDSMALPRVDLIKIDVEGMELEALEGAKATIERSMPVMLIESIKTKPDEIKAWLEQRGYVIVPVGINLLAIHASDMLLTELAPHQTGAQPMAQSSAA